MSQVAPFGATLHVVGLDPAKLASELGEYAAAHGLAIAPDQTSLEDVFIHFMSAEANAHGAPSARGP